MTQKKELKRNTDTMKICCLGNSLVRIEPNEKAKKIEIKDSIIITAIQKELETQQKNQRPTQIFSAAIERVCRQPFSCKFNYQYEVQGEKRTREYSIHDSMYYKKMLAIIRKESNFEQRFEQKAARKKKEKEERRKSLEILKYRKELHEKIRHKECRKNK